MMEAKVNGVAMPGKINRRLAPDEGWVIDPEIEFQLEVGKVIEVLRFSIRLVSPCLDVLLPEVENGCYFTCQVVSFFLNKGVMSPRRYTTETASMFKTLSAGKKYVTTSTVKALAIRECAYQVFDDIVYDAKYVMEAYKAFIAVYCGGCDTLRTMRSSESVDADEQGIAHRNCVKKPRIIRFNDLSVPPIFSI